MLGQNGMRMHGPLGLAAGHHSVVPTFCMFS